MMLTISIVFLDRCHFCWLKESGLIIVNEMQRIQIISYPYTFLRHVSY